MGVTETSCQYIVQWWGGERTGWIDSNFFARREEAIQNLNRQPELYPHDRHRLIVRRVTEEVIEER